MNDKLVRICNRCLDATTEEAQSFIPKNGELITYRDYTFIGDGVNTLFNCDLLSNESIVVNYTGGDEGPIIFTINDRNILNKHSLFMTVVANNYETINRKKINIDSEEEITINMYMTDVPDGLENIPNTLTYKITENSSTSEVKYVTMCNCSYYQESYNIFNNDITFIFEII